ncbi:MAG: sensor histidine kinase, partial [Myxococcaceae bacterium]
GAVMVVRDLTAEKELERLRDEFAAVIAHDLRNPIQVVLLQVHLLLKDTVGQEVTAPRKSLERIRGAAVRLARMVGDLLDATRIDVARLVLDRRPLAVPEAVERLVDQIRPVLAKHPVSVSVTGEIGAALLDPVRFDQVLVNLLENAAKYSPDDAPIRVKIAAGAGGVEIRIEDEGIGFSPADLSRLFGRFFQARRTRERQSGLGLGLHITRGLVEAHGGQIAVESELGRGSTFRLWFPTLPEEDPCAATR